MVEVADLIEPIGPVQPSMFPGDTRGDETQVGTLDHRIRGYIDDGKARVEKFQADNADVVEGFDGDSAVVAWASYRAFAARFIALSSDPANAALTDQGSRGYLQKQIAAFEERAKEYRAEFQAILAEALGKDEGQTRASYGTKTVPITFGL